LLVRSVNRMALLAACFSCTLSLAQRRPPRLLQCRSIYGTMYPDFRLYRISLSALHCKQVLSFSLIDQRRYLLTSRREKENTMSTPANFNGQRPVIDANDAVMLLIDHQSGLFQTVADMPMTELRARAAALASIATLSKLPVITTA